VNTFAAPWGRALRLTSLAAIAICAGLPLLFALVPEGPASPVFDALALLLPLGLLAGCGLFTVRAYRLSNGTLEIRRLLWWTRLPLAGLRSVEVRPDALTGAIRTCGNGGFFSFTGWYWSKSLGPFRAYVTDLRNTVVLRFERRTLLLSPADPEAFARALRAAADLGD
jgi:hypothetical protein